MSFQELEFEDCFNPACISQYFDSKNERSDQKIDRSSIDIFSCENTILSPNFDEKPPKFKSPQFSLETDNIFCQTIDNSPDKFRTMFDQFDSYPKTDNHFKTSTKKNKGKNWKLNFYKNRTTSVGCACEATKCLRRYCPCFANGGVCSAECRCLNCLNSVKFQKERELVIEKTKMITKNSFTAKIIKTKTGKIINSEGCKCKSGCQTSKCACSKNNIGCSPICKCTSCQNKFINLNKQEVLENFKASVRTRDKIILKDSDESTSKSANKIGALLPDNRKLYTIEIMKAHGNSAEEVGNELSDLWYGYENQGIVYDDVFGTL